MSNEQRATRRSEEGGWMAGVPVTCLNFRLVGGGRSSTLASRFEEVARFFF